VSTVVTEAIVLHAMPYSESSRILRLATRDHGIQSVLARGARAAQKRFGSALDLFAEGEAEFTLRPGRDLHTLVRFDVLRARVAIGSALARFDGASALAEVVLRMAMESDAAPETFAALRDGLDRIADSDAPATATIASVWRLMDALGVAPALSACIGCDRAIPADADASFSATQGGVVCDDCARGAGARPLPAAARADLVQFLAGRETDRAMDPLFERAHRRLLYRFIHAHLSDGRALRAFDLWANGTDLVPTPAPGGASLA
jgi:DNA repair protein RecO (recombination protein O)